MTLLKLLRPHQYLKNGFVWLGFIFAGRYEWGTFFQVGLAFLAFCSAASAMYVLNDIVDVESDRSHPTKRNRPIASGAIPTNVAGFLSAGLSIIALAIAFFVSSTAVSFVAMYLLVTTAYSWKLKHVVILDVFIISGGFMLRILVGTLGVGIAPSHWLLLTGLMVTLFLGFAKRRSELIVLENVPKSERARVRRVLESYSPVVLDQLSGITAACTILSYGLYTVSSEAAKIHGNNALFYTLPFVIYGMFRYLYLLHHHAKGSDAAKDLMTDSHLIATALGWLVVTVVVLLV